MSLIVAMCFYSLSMSLSPGPVNLITLSTGVNYGFKRALPFVSGATAGFTLLLLTVGLGANQVSENHTMALEVLKVAGSMFIAYMGFKIATASANLSIKNSRTPTFVHGFLLQWLNPKAWIASVAGVTAFHLSQSQTKLILFVSIYFVICFMSICAWAAFGSKLKQLISSQTHIRIVNTCMGSVLILVALYLLLA